MGQLCSRPKTVEDETEAHAENVQSRPAEQHKASPSSLNGHQGSHHHVSQTPYVPPETQPSDAELSELDVVVQQMRNSHNSVTGSAPGLLQQWDHDHRVVLDLIDTAIQVQRLSPAFMRVTLSCCSCQS